MVIEDLGVGWLIEPLGVGWLSRWIGVMVFARDLSISTGYGSLVWVDDIDGMQRSFEVNNMDC